MPISQENRHLSITTSLGDGKLGVVSFHYSEQLGRLFQAEVDVISESADINLDQLVGTSATVTVEDADGVPRYFNGLVSRFVHTGWSGRYASYRMSLVPNLWLLSRTSDCRIFQNKTIPQIVKEVLDLYGVSGETISMKLQATYVPWDYCVQYRETALNFVSRLLEQEGIYFFHEHTATSHKLVLVDNLTAHKPCKGSETIYYEGRNKDGVKKGVVTDWVIQRELQPGSYEVKDFDFIKPKLKLEGVEAAPGKYKKNDYAMYDYPGEFDDNGEGKRYAKVRIQELSCMESVARGQTNAIGLVVGGKFKLSDYARKDQNADHLVTGISVQAANDSFEGEAGSGEGDHFSCSFSAIPATKQFRTPRLTPKPIVQGPQTAMVTGPSGEEIHTDKYGRIKVLFHWDRYGKADDTSSCWVRVSQAAWAGKKWGSIYIPRVGQEVVVEFLEGDPDCPLVTGRVYNNDSMPPYDLPAEKTKSSLKSNSSKGGSGFNEIRFEDKKGQEQIFVHAEKQRDLRVKKDNLEWIGENEHLIVGKDRFIGVKGDQHLKVTGEHNEQVGMDRSLKVGMNLQQKAGMKSAMQAGTEIHLKAGTNVTIEAGVSITLKAGGGFIVVGPAGVTISGTPVLINSGGAAGSGGGCSPTPPKKPKEADKALSGSKNAPAAGNSRKPKPPTPSPGAVALGAASKSGAAFCAICN